VQITAADMLDVTGGDLAAAQVTSNTSDALVSRVQAHQDMQIYIFIDNMSRAMQRCGKIYLSMACDIYTEDNRKFSANGEDGSPESTSINVPSIDANGAPTIARTFTPGLDVFVDVGPAFNSRKDSTVNAIAKILPGITDPQMQQLMVATLVRNLDGEGMEDLSKFARMQLVKAGVVKPNDEEAEELQAEQQAAANAPPDAQTVALLAQARKDAASATQSEASAVQALSTAELNQAKAAESISNTNASQLSTIMTMLQGIQDRVNQQAGQVNQDQPQSPMDGKVNQAISTGQATPSPGVNALHGTQQVDPTAQALTAGNAPAAAQAPVHVSNRPAVGH
jgi:hypothetical protein